MTLSTFDCIAAITAHSAGLAEAARDADLQAPVEHCPGWSVADLVWHLSEVHWFWGTIVSELLTAPPPDDRRPGRPADDELVDGFVAGAAALVQALREADQFAHCWTWAGWQQDVAFVTRHQVQEAAVHHWDAAHAGAAHDTAQDTARDTAQDTDWHLDPAVAADCVDEMLDVALPSDADHDDPPNEPLAGSFALRASDTGDAWLVTDGDLPGTARVTRVGIDTPGTGDVPVLEAGAAELILWLYSRIELDTSAVPEDLLGRFMAL
jgi:uncharacterized protein (TIGR03083 family)